MGIRLYVKADGMRRLPDQTSIYVYGNVEHYSLTSDGGEHPKSHNKI